MKWLIFLVLLAALPIVAASDEINVQIFEDGKITNYRNQYWVVQVNGTGTVANPSDEDLFDVRLFYDILSLQVVDRGGDGSFQGDSLYFDRIPASGSASFSYTIIGITSEPPTLQGKGVLYTGLSKRSTRIYSDVFGELQKAPLEDPSVTNRDARLISVTLTNPYEFQYTIESMRVIKTPDLNPNNELDEWVIVDESAPRILDENGFFVHDFLDLNATEGEVYWLQTEVFISRVGLIDNNTVIRFTETNLTVPLEELNFTNETNNLSSPLIVANYALRKRLSDSVAVPGQPLTVSLLLYNFGERLREFSLTDSLPAGFVSDDDLSWEGTVPGRGSRTLTYQVYLNETQTAGFDAFPRARAVIDDREVFSPEVPFLRQFISDDKVFVQKRVEFRDDDKAVVTIQVQNLGTNPLRNARLREYLEDSDLFSEITEIPESKGIWKLPIISPGDEWSVQYVTESGDSLQSLPAIFGVDTHQVLRSIVLENVVNEAWEFVRTNILEFAGILLIIVFPFGLYFSRRYLLRH